MFVMADLRDWVALLGYGQAKTSNLDRLAESGLLHLNAHAPRVYCAPSRTAIWTGLQASTTGCDENQVFRYDCPEMTTLKLSVTVRTFMS
jgi:arylsulfatase A-like enzyme